jgi:hypothetical protein
MARDGPDRTAAACPVLRYGLEPRTLLPTDNPGSGLVVDSREVLIVKENNPAVDRGAFSGHFPPLILAGRESKTAFPFWRSER